MLQCGLIIFQKCVFTHVNGQMWSTVELPSNMSASVCYYTVCYSAALFSKQSIFKDLCNQLFYFIFIFLQLKPGYKCTWLLLTNV